ncbi:interleukin-6 receptor subunit alpha [Pelodytes ibericus]
MSGGEGWSDPHLLLLGAVIMSFADCKETLCPKPVVSQSSLVVPLSSSVNFTCPGFKDSVSCKHHNQRRPVSLLTNVQYKDVANYSCHSRGGFGCEVELLVTEDLKTPIILCYLRHPTSNITCEWTTTEKLPPRTKAVLLFQLGLDTRPEKYPCSYHRVDNRYKCRVMKHHEEMDPTTRVFLSVCVTSQTDSRQSKMINSNRKKLVQPDVPLNVIVSPLRGSPRKLSISWDPPKRWRSKFHGLVYEIQYRAENLQHTSNVTTTNTSYVMEDAIMERKHCVKVRAKDEFGYGLWSRWSQEAEGTPWTDIRKSFTEDPLNSDMTFYLPSETTEYVTDSRLPDNDPTKSALRQYRFLVVGVNLGILVFLLAGILLRRFFTREYQLKHSKLRYLLLPFARGDGAGALSNSSLHMRPCASPAAEKYTAPRDPAST